ncbi:hypothetical protein V1264_014778 [Littorina saxatilis]|uniref:Uncharacterized protein n=1 Tax=Littorina saxatilis TaxID=31220 RepID=A0AAN9GLE0_9CAEN
MAAHSDNGRDFSKLNCESLREYLKARGISATGYCKQSLVRLATCARGLSLETDPDSSNVDVASQVKSSLQGLNFPVLGPFTLPFSDDFSLTPMIGLIDVFNYLIDSRTDFDKKATKAYKSYEDYRLFHDGHVLELKCWNNERLTSRTSTRVSGDTCNISQTCSGNARRKSICNPCNREGNGKTCK